jgi:hypothetical protein
MPKDTIGACFNADGVAWAWNEKPEIKGNEAHPNFLRWRGSEYGKGYTLIGPVVASDYAKKYWKESWTENPKAKK